MHICTDSFQRLVHCPDVFFMFGFTGAADSSGHPQSVAESDDDAFGEFLSGVPRTQVSPAAALSAAEDGSQDNGAAGATAPVKQSQTGQNCFK